MDTTQTLSGHVAAVRQRLITCDLPRRRIASEADVSWATVRRFAESGAGNVDTVAAIEAALDRLVSPPSGDAARRAAMSNVTQN